MHALGGPSIVESSNIHKERDSLYMTFTNTIIICIHDTYKCLYYIIYIYTHIYIHICIYIYIYIHIYISIKECVNRAWFFTLNYGDFIACRVLRLIETQRQVVVVYGGIDLNVLVKDNRKEKFRYKIGR